MTNETRTELDDYLTAWSYEAVLQMERLAHEDEVADGLIAADQTDDWAFEEVADDERTTD